MADPTMDAGQALAELERRVEQLGRRDAEHWLAPPAGARRIDLLRAFARGAGWEVYFDAHGQAVSNNFV